MQSKPLQLAYAECQQLANSHYENFPTASKLVQKKHRQATAAIYSFARRADDFADEGNYDNETRFRMLNQFDQYLDDVEHNKPIDDLTFIALADTINEYNLPLLPFRKLLQAFRMDVEKNRYSSFDELLYYCQHSANPIGELVLRIHGVYTDQTARLSDNICTALQLINFMQDIDEDFQQRNRIYLPQNELLKYSVSEQSIASRKNSEELKSIVGFQLERSKQMLLQGAPLVNHLRGRLKWVIKFTINGGLLICEKCQKRSNVFLRPTLSRTDALSLLAKSIYFRPG